MALKIGLDLPVEVTDSRARQGGPVRSPVRVLPSSLPGSLKTASKQREQDNHGTQAVKRRHRWKALRHG